MEDFASVWNDSANVEEVCQKTGKSRRHAICKASLYRSRGTEMKFMPKAAPTSALLGEEFGKWRVIEVLPKNKRLCVCQCGTTRIVVAATLINGSSTGCYCTWKDRPIDENAKKWHPLYKVWVGVKNRCKNKNAKDFRNYGGRGISICERWDNSFADFIADMGQRPSSKHSIDRFPDKNGNYEPGNCRWATSEEQGNNTRVNHILTVKGRSQTVAQWAKEIGIASVTIHSRLHRGWNDEDAVSVPVDQRKKNSHANRK